VFRVAVLSFWHVHAKGYALETKEHPGAEVTAVCNEDRKRGQVEASERGVPFHDDLEGLLSREDVDGVVVTAPTVAHRAVIPAAARAGKHVFAEKVIAPTLGAHRDPQLLSRPPAESGGDGGATGKDRGSGARDLGREGPILEPEARRASSPLGPEPPARRAPAEREPLGRRGQPPGGEHLTLRLPALPSHHPSGLTS
jgi:Oxidoreductase family, NAD-binding Rossmann fold